MPVATIDVATHKRVHRFASDQWIDFPGAEHTIPWVSFSSVYDPKRLGPPTATVGGKQVVENFRGKVVVIGATQLSLQDFHATSSDGQMAGPEIQADAIATILRGFPLKSAPGWVNVLLIVLMAVAVPAASLRLGPVPSLAITLGLAALFAA